MGIPLGHVRFFMPEQPLDLIQVNPCLDQPGRKGVPEVVESEVLNLGFFSRTLKASGQVSWTDGSARGGGKDKRAFLVAVLLLQHQQLEDFPV